MLLRFTLRELRGRPGRAALTLFGIALGVATVVAVWSATSAVRRGFHGMFDSVAGRATLELVAEGEGGLDPALRARVAAVPGVAAAVPLVQAPAALLLEGKTMPIYALGIDPALDRAARDYRLRAGTLLETPGLVLPAGMADELGLELGDDCRLLSGRGWRVLPVVGLLEPEGAAMALGGSGTAFLTLADAQQLAGLDGRLSAVQVVPAEGARAAELERALRAVAPEGALVQRPASRGELATLAMTGTEIGLVNAGVLSIVLGAFLILNTFLMNLGERRKQLATLRATGATRAQVGRMILIEAALFGAVGALLGVPVGLAAAWAITSGVAQLLEVALPPFEVGPTGIALGLLLGPVVSVLAALLPAVLARDVSPLELMRERRGSGEGAHRWLSVVGAVTLIGTGAGAVGLITGRLDPSWSVVNTAAALASVILIVPALLSPLITALRWLLRPLIGVTEVIALRQLLRQPLRNSLTIGVIAAALAMSIGMGNSILTNVDTLWRFVDRSIVGDFIVRSVMPDPTLLLVPSIPDAIGDELRAIDGVTGIRPVKFLQVRADGQRAVLLARGRPAGGAVHLDLLRGEPEQVRRGLEQGGAALGSRLARAIGKDVGDSFELATPDGPRPTRVVGVMTEFVGGGMALDMQFDTARALYGFTGADAFMVDAAPERRAAVEATLRAFTRERGLLLQSNRDFRDLVERLNAGVIGSLWALLGVLLLVAAFGVVNTLTMNVLEQTRELGLLRAVAMTQGQVRRAVVAQAGAMALVACAPGVAVGVVIAYLMNAAAPALLGIEVELALYGWFVGVAALAACAITLIAGWLPALRAARLDVIEALKYE